MISQVRKVQFSCIAVVALLAFGLWANLPYLMAEHRRLELWKTAGLWFGDVMGLLWFVQFAITHAVLGEPLAPVPVSNGRRRLRFLVLIGVAALLIDLAMSLYLMYDERAGYEHGRLVEAQVVVIQEHKRELATGYDLDCTFKDENGVQHRAHVRVLAKQHMLPGSLPAETVRVLTARGEGQNLIRLRYDPRLPERAWIDGLGWQDENGIYWVSVAVTAFQAGLTAVFLLLLTPGSSGGMWPWWADIYKVLPLVAEAFMMLLMGLIDRIMDSVS